MRPFIQRNLVRHCANQYYIRKIGRLNKHASVFISREPNCRHFSSTILSSLNLNPTLNVRWRYISTSSISYESEDKKFGAVNEKNKDQLETKFTNIIGEQNLRKRYRESRGSDLSSKVENTTNQQKIQSDAGQKAFITAVMEKIFNIVRNVVPDAVKHRIKILFGRLDEKNAIALHKIRLSLDINDEKHTIQASKRKLDMVMEKDKKVTAEEANAAKPDIGPSKNKIQIDIPGTSLGRNFITPSQVMLDFSLSPADLESLPKANKKSPHEDEPPITVYWREDVELKVLEDWVSSERPFSDLLKMELKQKMDQKKRRLLYYDRGNSSNSSKSDNQNGFLGGYDRLLASTLIKNSKNIKQFIWMFCAWHTVYSSSDICYLICYKLIITYGTDKFLQVVRRLQQSNAFKEPFAYDNQDQKPGQKKSRRRYCESCGRRLYETRID